MTDTAAAAPPSPFSDLLRELYHGRSWVGRAGRLPRRPAHRLRRVDDRPRREHDDQPGVADGAGRRPGAGHGRAERRPTGLVAGRALPRLHVQARREGEGGDPPRDAGRRPGRGAHAGLDARGLHRADVVARRQADRLHQPHPRQALRRQGRELAAAPQDRDVLHAAQRRRLDRRPADPRLRRQRRRHRHAAQPDPRAARSRRRLLVARLERRSSPVPGGTRAGTSTSPPTSTSCRSTARSGPSPTRPATTRTRPCRPTASRVALLGMDDPQVDPQNAAVGSHRHRRRGDHVDLHGARSQLAALLAAPGSRCGPTTTRCSPSSRIAARPICTSWQPTAHGRRRRSPRARSPCKASTPPAAWWRWPRRPCSALPSCSRSTARSRR